MAIVRFVVVLFYNNNNYYTNKCFTIFLWEKCHIFVPSFSGTNTHIHTHTHIERPPAHQVPHNLQVNLLTRMRAHISLNVRFFLMLLLSLIFFILCNLNIRMRAISGEFSPATIKM